MPTIAGIGPYRVSFCKHDLQERPYVHVDRDNQTAQRQNWQPCGGGGFGIHRPDINEDLSAQGLLAGAPAPRRAETIRAAPVRKRLDQYAKNIGLSAPPFPHSRNSDRNPPTTGPSELSFLSVGTRTPHVADYPGEDAGKTAHCMFRRVSTGGEKGLWSKTASARIGA